MADNALVEIAAWRANVSELVTDCCKLWGLRIGEAYAPSVPSHVVRVETPDGTPAVLKVACSGGSDFIATHMETVQWLLGDA